MCRPFRIRMAVTSSVFVRARTNCARGRRLRASTGTPDALGAESGSAAAEYVMVSALLTVVFLAVMQVALVLYVRNTVLDAAAEGARFAALAGNHLHDGIARTQELISRAIGGRYASTVSANSSDDPEGSTIEVRVRCQFPLVGLVGIPRGLEVSGHALKEGASHVAL